MRDKLKLTKELVELLPDQLKITADEARISWFYNIRNDGGLRLTTFGYETLVKLLKLEHYIYTIPDPLEFTKITILLLDRKLQMPYYIISDKKLPVKLVFFSSKEAMLANLYGNIEKFLDNYS
jgi:hypothetical protein